ncbi:MAG: peptidylprolyl isomerase, partial [Ignavibacteriaceae bacterium]
ISNPVESQFGFHLIQLLGVRGNEYNSRHILIPVIPTGEDIRKAKDELDSIRNLILLDSITFEKAAKDFSDDKITAANGGFLLDSDTGAPWISVEKLDPTTFFTIDTMQVNSISKASLFQTENGDNSVRILYFKGFIKPHQANLDQDYQKIRQAALSAKKSKILNDWFNNARFDVFINIDDEYNYCNILN